MTMTKIALVTLTVKWTGRTSYQQNKDPPDWVSEWPGQWAPIKMGVRPWRDSFSQLLCYRLSQFQLQRRSGMGWPRCDRTARGRQRLTHQNWGERQPRCGRILIGSLASLIRGAGALELAAIEWVPAPREKQRSPGSSGASSDHR